jgi:hypothetical protein
MALQNTPVNNNNLVRFISTDEPTIASSQYSNGLHNGYLYKWRKHNDYIPILAGDTFVMYTNFDSDVLGTNTIKVIEGETVIDDVNKYVISTDPWGTNNKKITLNVPLTNTQNKKTIQLGIVAEGGDILYKSNCFLLLQPSEKNINNTHLFKFYNTSNVYNYDWADYVVGVDDPYTIRLASSIKELSYQIEKSTYKEATTGRVRTSRQTTTKQYQFEIYYADENTHDALAFCTSLKYLEINGKEFIVDEYSSEYQPNLNLFKSVITLTDVEYGRRITTCD